MVSLIQSNYEASGRASLLPVQLCAARSRRTLQHGSKFTKRSGGTEEAIAHDHSGVRAKGDVRVAFGNHGRGNQSQAHATVCCEPVDFKMNIQAALEAAEVQQAYVGGIT